MRRVIFIMILAITIVSTLIPVYADDTAPEILRSGIYTLDKINAESEHPILDPSDENILGKIENFFQRKGDDIIFVLQRIVQPFTIIVFIISAFITLIGSILDSNLLSKGFWGMCISVFVYAIVLYAPVIVPIGANWVAS